jgi:hypothetical protein
VSATPPPAGGGLFAGPDAQKAAQVAGTMAKAFGTSAVRAIGTQVGRQIMRGLLGGLTGRK